MWKRSATGRELHFHLAGINNQNFIMRDEETGSFWQQVSGKAISGPLAGTVLALQPSDELSFALWKSEAPNGTVLAPVSTFAAKYAKSDWEQEVGALPVVVDFPESKVPAREIVLGLSLNGADRAYFFSSVRSQNVIQDRLGGKSISIVLGPDNQSVRAFFSEINGKSVQFFRRTGEPWALLDSETGSEWNFQGCATSGAIKDTCLNQVQLLKDYWFDWRLYHPETTVYRR